MKKTLEICRKVYLIAKIFVQRDKRKIEQNYGVF